MSYDTHLKKWEEQRSGITEESWKKLNMLLRTKDATQIRSSFELLFSYGEASLCAILHEKNEQLYLRNKSHHPVLWISCILEEVRQEKSVWHDLYTRNYFHRLERYWYGNVAWKDLSEEHQKKAREKSLRSVEVPAGSFVMGPVTGFDTENIRHKVTLTRPMNIGVYPCTQALYESVMGENPSKFVGSMRPVDNVSWCDTVLFCNKLSEIEGLQPCYTLPVGLERIRRYSWKDRSVDFLSDEVKWNKEASGYRLPTEAEWEYCARGGEEHYYAGSNVVYHVAWYYENARYRTYPVGERRGNKFGLYDMSGNVWEFCWAFYVYSEGVDAIDPIGDERYMNQGCPRRGGSYNTIAIDMSVDLSESRSPSCRSSNTGFRLIRTLL